MKEQLTKFKTQFDLHANYNQKGLFQAQKHIYEPEISLSDRLEEKAEKNFTLKPLQIGFIQSLTLKDDPKFKEIQKIYNKYNVEVVTMNENPASGLHLKKVVMESMLKFLRMMMLAPDAACKKTILDISYYWFIKHLNPKSQRKPQATMLKQIKKIVTENNLLPRQIIEKELPSEKLKEELYYYRVKARTQHRDLDAPQHQLQNYHIHKVGYITQKTTKVESQQELRRKRLLRMKFIRPNLQQYYLPPPEEEQKQPEKVQNAPQVPVSPQPQQVPDPNQPPPPAQQPPMNAEMIKQMQLLNQMGGEPQEPEQPPPEDDEDKKRGKLDPLVKVFLKKQQQQREKEASLPETSISQLQRYRNNYKEVLQRQDEIFAKCMNDWGSKKARLKTEAARRIQSIRMNHTQTIESHPPKAFEQSFYETRINQALKEGRMYVKGQLSKQKLNTQASFSCFDRRRIKTVACSANKPFSEIIEQNKRVNMKEEALDEISYIKQKFAKQKIFASLQAMKKGLMHPEEDEKGEGQVTEKIQYPTNLMSNPFFVVKKKKKKGKKKK